MQRDITEMLDSAIENEPTLKSLADQLRNWSTQVFLEGPLRPLKTFLNGTWLEHPLHPLLTDIPVGAWTISMLLDALDMAGVEGLGEASGIATGAGVATAAGAAVSGFMDYTDSESPEQTLAFTHGLINVISTLLFTASFLSRWRDGWELKPKHVLLSGLGYLTVTLGAYLGGSLVFRNGVMVNRNAYRKGPKEFTNAIAADALMPGHMKRVEVNGQPILLLKENERIYAISAVCSHYGGPLEKGRLVDGCVECPYHYSLYSLEDGSYKSGPTTSPVPAYDTRIQDGQIQVKLRM